MKKLLAFVFSLVSLASVAQSPAVDVGSGVNAALRRQSPYGLYSKTDSSFLAAVRSGAFVPGLTQSAADLRYPLLTGFNNFTSGYSATIAAINASLALKVPLSTYNSDMVSLISSIGTKANTGDSYLKAESDGRYRLSGPVAYSEVSGTATGVSSGTYGSGTAIPRLVIGPDGRAVSAGTVAISIPQSVTTLSGLDNTATNYQTGAQVTGAVSAGVNSLTPAIAANTAQIASVSATAGQALTTANSATATGASNAANIATNTAQIAGKQDKPTFIQLATSRYLTDADNGKILYNTTGSTITITISNTLTLPLNIYLSQEGTGPIVVATSGGMTLRTLNNSGNNRTAGQWTMAQLTAHAGTDVILSGQTDLVSGDYVTFVDDNFQRANTTPPAGIGSPSIFSTPSTGAAWGDPSSAWKIINNTLVPGAGITNSLIGPTRPASENFLNQGVSFTTGSITTSATYSTVLRQQASDPFGAGILVNISFNSSAQTAYVQVGNSTGTSEFNLVNGATFPIILSHSYILTAKAESLYPGGFTVVSYSVADAANQSVALSSGAVYTPFSSMLLVSNVGNFGLTQQRSDIYPTAAAVYTDFQALKKVSLGLTTIVSGGLVVSTAGNYVSVSGSGNWTAGSTTTTFTLSGAAATGASITSTSIISSKLARLQITTGAATGLLRITEVGTANIVDVLVTSSATGGLVPTNIVQKPSSTTANVLVSLGLVTGGKAPYTFQWHRSTAWDFTPGAGTILTGATGIDLIDIPPDNQLYAYKCVVTDASGTPLTATTFPVVAMRNYQELPASLYTLTTGAKTVKIGYMGDSNMQDTSKGLISSFQSALTTRNITVAASSNQGVSGSYTSQWIAGTANYNNAKAAFQGVSGGITHIVFMLGTNDAGSFNVSKATFLSNLNNTLAQLNTDFPGVKVVLMTPQIYLYSYFGNANTSLIQYVDAIDQAVAANPSNALRGDRNFMEYSYGRFDRYGDSIHLKSSGYAEMAQYWADAFLRRIDGL